MAERKQSHEWDDDGCCKYCGFDGAEWWHWKHNTYEGKASDLKQPKCGKNPNFIYSPEDRHNDAS